MAPPIRAASTAQPSSRCLITTTLDRRPAPVLAMEPFEIDILVRPHCLPAAPPEHIAIAVAVLPGAQPADLRDAAKVLIEVATDMRERGGDGRRVAVAIPAAGGGYQCRLSGSVSHIRRCVSRVTDARPLERGALSSAMEQGEQLLVHTDSPYPRDNIREVLMLLTVQPTRSGSFDGECVSAMRAAQALKRQGILVVTGWIATRPAADAGRLRHCLRQVATSPRYAFEDRSALMVRVFEQVRLHPERYPRTIRLRIALPEHISVATASSNNAGVAINPFEVDAVGGGHGFDLNLVLRSGRPGYVPLTGAMRLDWVEPYGLPFSAIRPPIGRILTLAPRRLVTPTPGAVSVLPRVRSDTVRLIESSWLEPAEVRGAGKLENGVGDRSPEQRRGASQ